MTMEFYETSFLYLIAIRKRWSKMTDSHLGLCIHVLYDGSSGKSGMLLLMLLLIMVLMRQRVSSLALLEKRVGIVRRAFHNVPGTTIDRYELRNSYGLYVIIGQLNASLH